MDEANVGQRIVMTDLADDSFQRLGQSTRLTTFTVIDHELDEHEIGILRQHLRRQPVAAKSAPVPLITALMLPGGGRHQAKLIGHVGDGGKIHRPLTLFLGSQRTEEQAAQRQHPRKAGAAANVGRDAVHT
jgi:hypothetical protein